MANPTDKRFHQLTLAIQKAINSIETPVKEKHVRSTIIGTFQEQSAVTYWMVAIRQPLQDNRIVAWKFCHVTHKLLREGHPACLDDSQRHIGMIENLGKLWVHLREGYGRLVHLYCNLLVCKLKFHNRNPRFPGNMQLTADELDAIAENDVNNYFQLCVELFDYMDDILNLQAAVFESLGNARANSMTASGQCRLAALIPCAQDSSHIYDCNVRLLFRLHAALPPDTLAGHRERFRQQFKKLSSFYKHASSLQYYRNLLTLPVLPSNPPNFLLQSDFGTYVTPVVSIPEPPPDEVDSIGSLIDTSDTISQASHMDQMETFDTRTTPSPQPDPIVERDRLIDHLQNELKRMRSEVSQLVQERSTMLSSMREHCTRLENQLQATKSELVEEKQKAEILSAEAPAIQQKLAQTEDKAKVIDEKFQKLKGAYTQLREEHIALIRQKAEVDKMASSLRAAAVQHESAKMMLQQQLNDRMKDVELLQQSASSSEEIEAYKNEISTLRIELENSRQKEVELESIRASMETLEIEHKTTATEQQEKVILMANELKEVTENLEKVRKEKEEREMELNKTKEELLTMKQKNVDEFKKVMEEKLAAVQEIDELKHKYQQEKEAQNSQQEILIKSISDLEKIIISKNEKIAEISTNLDENLVNIENVRNKLETCQNENKMEVRLLQEKLQANINSKEEVIQNLKDIIEEKDKQVITLNVEINKLSDEVSRLTDELKETAAELEIGKNELINLKEEHENIISRNEKNLALINNELRMVNDEINKLTSEKKHIETEKEEIITHLKQQNQVLENNIDKMNETIATLNNNAFIIQNEKINIEYKLNDEIDHLKEESRQLNTEHRKIMEENYSYIQMHFAKDATLGQVIKERDDAIIQLDELEKLQIKIKEDMNLVLSEKEKEYQMINARLEHTETERLNAECELQDLLQHNTVLEADIASLKAQLQEAQMEVKRQTLRLVTCAGEAALEVTNGALESFEHGNVRDTYRLSAELATKAFDELAKNTDINGNEESIAKSAISAAHNTAQLSAYIMDICNVSTDIDLSDSTRQTFNEG